jgi:hypothetical protein
MAGIWPGHGNGPITLRAEGDRAVVVEGRPTVAAGQPLIEDYSSGTSPSMEVWYTFTFLASYS